MNHRLMAKRMDALGYSCHALARKLVVAPSTVWRWRTGKGEPRRVGAVFALAVALDIHPNDLFPPKRRRA